VRTRTVNEWRVRITRCLKGDLKPGDFVLIGHNVYRSMPRALVEPTVGESFLVFLEQVRRPVSRNAFYVPSENWDYIVLGIPNSVDLGAHRISPGHDPLVAQVIRAIKEQEPADLARAADLIVFGIPDFDHQVACSPYGRTGGCIPVAVTKVLAGAPQQAVHMFSLVPFYKPFGSGVLMFLSRKTSGDYELVHGPASFIPIGKNGQDAHGRSLAEWRDFVSKARSLRTEATRIPR